MTAGNDVAFELNQWSFLLLNLLHIKAEKHLRIITIFITDSKIYIGSVIPQPGSQGGSESKTGGTADKSGGQGKTIGIVILVFSVAILACVALIVFHKKERRYIIYEFL